MLTEEFKIARNKLTPPPQAVPLLLKRRTFLLLYFTTIKVLLLKTPSRLKPYLPLAKLGCTRCKNPSKLGSNSFAQDFPLEEGEPAVSLLTEELIKNMPLKNQRRLYPAKSKSTIFLFISVCRGAHSYRRYCHTSTFINVLRPR